jgi:hypothetical protein
LELRRILVMDCLFAELVPIYGLGGNHISLCTSTARYRESLLCPSGLC